MQTVDQAGKRGVSAQLLQQIQDLLPRNGIKSRTKYQGRRTEPPLPISSAALGFAEAQIALTSRRCALCLAGTQTGEAVPCTEW